MDIILVLIINNFIDEENSEFCERMKKALTERLRVRIKGMAESGEIILGGSATGPMAQETDQMRPTVER